MSYFELFLLAVGLCFDTFAVSLTGGICFVSRPRWSGILKIIFSFGVFQAGFTLLGWALGSSVSSYIESFDHWIAFLLLAYIGGNMIRESFAREEETSGTVDLLCTRKLCVLSVATSIDALAVGISLAMIQLENVKVWTGSAMIMAVTAMASLTGLFAGRAVGPKFGKRSELVGGVILICIGLKILLEHLGPVILR